MNICNDDSDVGIFFMVHHSWNIFVAWARQDSTLRKYPGDLYQNTGHDFCSILNTIVFEVSFCKS